MKIWITGIAGFLGSHLRDALITEGHEVFGNDNMLCGDISNLPDESCFTVADCRDHQTMARHLAVWKPDVLVHCAATAHEGLSTFSPSFITKNIYGASVSTFSAAVSAGVKRIVFMSSMSRYGAGDPFPPPFKEGFNTAPVDPYGIAKVAAEQTLKVLCDTHGVKWAIAVPHNIIGTRQRSIDPYRNVAAIMINRCKQRKPPIIYGDGMQMRCFSPVADVLPSLVRMVNGEADGQIINIGPDKAEITIKDLAYAVMRITGFDGIAQYVPGRPNEVKDAFCCSQKARTLLGYEPKQSLEDCLKEMADYIQPKEFEYSFPLEIITPAIPKTWLERLI